MKKLLFVLIALAIVVSAFVVNPTPAYAGTETPEISSYDQLPVKGQLIIPPGQQFVVPEAWDTLRLSEWRGLSDADIAPVIAFGNSIASDRADRYGGVAADYVTVIWSQHPIPGFTSRRDCDQAFGNDQAILTVGTSIGDAGCYTVLEYDITAVLQDMECTTCSAATEEVVVIVPLASETPAPTAMEEAAAAAPVVVPTNTTESTATPSASVQTAPATPVPTNWNPLVWFLGIAALLAAVAYAIWRLRPTAEDKAAADKAKADKAAADKAKADKAAADKAAADKAAAEKAKADKAAADKAAADKAKADKAAADKAAAEKAKADKAAADKAAADKAAAEKAKASKNAVKKSKSSSK